jgi:uncharacterized protein
MSRLILLVIVIAVAYWLLRSYLKQAPKEEQPSSEAMVQCARCGVHLPQSGAILADGKHFCCEAHRREYAEHRE